MKRALLLATLEVEWLIAQLRAERARAEKLEHLALSTAKIADEQERRADAAQRIIDRARREIGAQPRRHDDAPCTDRCVNQIVCDMIAALADDGAEK